MNVQDLIRFWKTDQDDEDLTEQKKGQQLPPSPAGQIELKDEELMLISGGSAHLHELRFSAGKMQACVQ